LVCLATWKK